MNDAWWEVVYERGAFAVPGVVSPEYEAQGIRSIDAQELIMLGRFGDAEYGEAEASRLAHLCASNALRAMGATRGDPNASNDRVAAQEECSKCGAKIDTAAPHARISVCYGCGEPPDAEIWDAWYPARFCATCGDVIEGRARALAAFAADARSEGTRQ